MKNILLLLLLLMNSYILGEIKPNRNLLERQPHWKISILERHKNGCDKIIEFSEVIGSEDVPTKRYYISDNGELLKEEDVCWVNNNGCKKVIADGITVAFYGKNSPKSVEEFRQGKLDGLSISFLP